MVRKPILSFIGLALLVGCGGQPRNASESASAVSAQSVPQSEPPIINAGISIEDAYAAIPHRRTVYSPSSSTISPAEQAYLQAIFQVLDEVVVVRISGQRNYAAGHLDYSDPVAQYDQLIAYVRTLEPPLTLTRYHQHILDALAGQRQFFVDWRAQPDQFPSAQKVDTHAGVRKASAALRAAYGLLVSNFPQEPQENKDAFFDYHCAADFL